jgi:UDP-N-acetylglucosamine 2-epimerase
VNTPPRKIVTVVGARPQFIKAAVLDRRLRADRSGALRQILVHTGQHYDENMSDVFFRQLEISRPDHLLDVGSSPAPLQTAAILQRLQPVLQSESPDAVVVFGDTNSTLAAALCAVQCGLPLIHIEAGERIWRREQVPEEVNRVVADHLARLCLTATRQSEANLREEGIAGARVRFTGDLLFDLFHWATQRPELRAVTPTSLGLEPGGYILATIHRAENTDDPERLAALLDTLAAAPLPVVLPLHPRARAALGTAIRSNGTADRGALRVIDPLGYFDLIGLLEGCRRCVTDSGGVIREAYFARRPSIVPMHGAYWPDILRAGWSLPVGHDLEALAGAIATFDAPERYIEGLFGDGDAAGRIVHAIVEMLDEPPDEGVWRPGDAAAVAAGRRP